MIETNPDHPDFDLGLEILACIPPDVDGAYVGMQDICTDFGLETQSIARAALGNSRAGDLIWIYRIQITNPGKGLGRGLSIPPEKWPAARDAALAYLAKNDRSLPDDVSGA